MVQKNYGPEVNLFVDHSQIIELESLRSGTWDTKSLWGRVATYKGPKRLPASSYSKSLRGWAAPVR